MKRKSNKISTLTSRMWKLDRLLVMRLMILCTKHNIVQSAWKYESNTLYVRVSQWQRSFEITPGSSHQKLGSVCDGINKLVSRLGKPDKDISLGPWKDKNSRVIIIPVFWVNAQWTLSYGVIMTCFLTELINLWKCRFWQ